MAERGRHLRRCKSRLMALACSTRSNLPRQKSNNFQFSRLAMNFTRLAPPIDRHLGFFFHNELIHSYDQNDGQKERW